MPEDGQQFLPPEILSMVFQYLPEQDIASCSMVCVDWREEINRNEIWRRLCLHRGWAEILDQPEVWSQTTPHVEPNFQTPVVKEGSRLSSLCSWHVDFLQSAHLYKNWKKGNYAIQKFDEVVSEHLGHVLVTSMDLNSMLVILGDDAGGVTIWEQAKSKPGFLKYVRCYFSDVVVSEIFLEGTSFAVLQLGLLQVYHKMDNEEYKMCFSKAMISNLSDSEPIQLTDDSELIYDWFVKNVYEYFDEDEFHYARACRDPILAFWGTLKSVEVLCLKPEGNLKALKIPYDNYNICDVALGPHASIVYIALENSVVGDVILEYNVDEDICTKQLKNSSTIMRIHVNHNFLISLNKQGIFTVWDCLKRETQNVLPSIGLTSYDTSLGLFGNSILYLSGNKIGSVAHSTGKSKFNEFELMSSSKFLTKGMGDLLILQNGEDIEVWSWADRTMKYSIKNILVKDDQYAAWCNDAYIVLWGFQTPPVLVWFW